jgi:hypothetical protein
MRVVYCRLDGTFGKLLLFTIFGVNIYPNKCTETPKMNLSMPARGITEISAFVQNHIFNLNLYFDMADHGMLTPPHFFLRFVVCWRLQIAFYTFQDLV